MEQHSGKVRRSLKRMHVGERDVRNLLSAPPACISSVRTGFAMAW